MFNRHVYGDVLQHRDQLGIVLSVLVDEIRITVDQLWQSVEHVELYSSDKFVRFDQHVDESGSRIFRVKQRYFTILLNFTYTLGVPYLTIK